MTTPPPIRLADPSHPIHRPPAHQGDIDMNLPAPPAAVIAWDPETGEPSRRAEPWPYTDACPCDSGLDFEFCCGDGAADKVFTLNCDAVRLDMAVTWCDICTESGWEATLHTPAPDITNDLIPHVHVVPGSDQIAGIAVIETTDGTALCGGCADLVVGIIAASNLERLAIALQPTPAA